MKQPQSFDYNIDNEYSMGLMSPTIFSEGDQKSLDIQNLNTIQYQPPKTALVHKRPQVDKKLSKSIDVAKLKPQRKLALKLPTQSQKDNVLDPTSHRNSGPSSPVDRYLVKGTQDTTVQSSEQELIVCIDENLTYDQEDDRNEANNKIQEFH